MRATKNERIPQDSHVNVQAVSDHAEQGEPDKRGDKAAESEPTAPLTFHMPSS